MSTAPFANTLFEKTSVLVQRHLGMLLAGSLEWKSAEGAGGDGGWDVCVCV